MNWEKLLKLIPVAAGIANPALGVAAETIISIVDKRLDEQSQQTGKTRDELIAEAGEKWDQNIAAAERLRDSGH